MCLRCQKVKEEYGLSCQLIEKQKEAQGPNVVLMQAAETAQQLQQALEQISSIHTALSDIQRHYQDQVCRYDVEE